MLTAVTGINWGDEGKGRVIDLLAEHADVVARYQGGNNAGHTVVTEQGKFILNLLPSGILHPDVVCVLGAGMVIDLDHLAGEMDAIEERGVKVGPENLKLSDKATISMPWHKVQDGLEEDRLAQKGAAFGSTRRGIAYAYSDKYRKKTLRLGDLLHLDEKRVQDRLHMILESKNLELGGCYHQEPMSYDALLEWCRMQAGQFAPYICDVGAFLQQAGQAEDMVAVVVGQADGVQLHQVDPGAAGSGLGALAAVEQQAVPAAVGHRRRQGAIGQGHGGRCAQQSNGQHKKSSVSFLFSVPHFAPVHNRRNGCIGWSR